MSKESRSTGVRRREFLKVLGAGSAAVATAACVPEKTGKLIPYFISPDETVPGVSTYYATSCRECAAGCGLIVETRDGRAIKLEGNPDHPVNHGALCARGQAALQGLYNPDRFRGPMVRQNGAWKSATWDEALALVGQHLGGTNAGGIFLNQHESGSFPGFVDQWLGAFGMRPHLSVDDEVDHASIEAHRRAYGVAWPRFAFSEAHLIVSIGADFLEGWGASVPQQLEFADARAKLESAPRFVYVGARRSLTGLNADQWIPCTPGSELAIANFLAGRGAAPDERVTGVRPEVLDALRTELQAAKPSLVLSGVTTSDALEVATAVAALNQSLGNVGVTIRPADAYTAFDGISPMSDVVDAVEQMRAGQVPVAFIRGTNPAHWLPKSLDFAGALSKVPFRVSFSPVPDETTELCDVVLPDYHSLESWGDAQAARGVIGVQQPTMDAVFANTRPTADVLIALAKKAPAAAGRFAAPDYRTWLISRFPGGETAFTAALARGMAPGTIAARPASAAAATQMRRAPALQTTQGDFFLVVYPSSTLGTGRGANKPWLLELPDPVQKIVWSSWVELHPDTAARLGIDRGDIVEVKTASGSVRAPAMPFLGVRPDTIAIALGYGHRARGSVPAFDPKASANPVQWGYGRYARGLGINASDLLPAGTDATGQVVLTATRATIAKTGDHETLPSTEGSARQHGRGIAQALTVEELQRGAGPEREEHELVGDASHAFLPGLRSPVAADAQGILGAPTAADHGKDKGLYSADDPRKMSSRRWAMTIDLARCTGCSACVTACYAENNIPTVGAPWQNATVFADQKPGLNVTRGREMNWLRLERYYEGAPDGHFGEEFETRFIPMLCQHCGNAPCEPVCPVYATYHSPDGLNVQVYNRCVGTRYCSNGCPYKVRYFNWFGYGEPDRKQYAFPEPLNWQLNPDVTVRGKGVMEKCTMCVQRIREAENRATLEQRELVPDGFTTSCAAACPSRAITFGDAADPAWTVTQLAQDRRAYHVFEELNTFTAVVYLKKVIHPASEAQTAPAGAAASPDTTRRPAGAR